MKKHSIFLLLPIFLTAANPRLNIEKVDLYTFVNIVSSASQTNILVDKTIPANSISFYVPNNLKPNQYLQSLRDLLSDQNLTLKKRTGYLYVTRPVHPKPKLFLYKFQNINVLDLSFLQKIYPTVRFQFHRRSNTLYFYSTPDIKIQIFNICKNIDLQAPTKSISLTIFSTDLQKLKNVGSKIDQFGFDLSDLISQMSKPISLSMQNVLQFKALLQFLQKNRVIEILQNPVLYLTDSKKAVFKSVKNVPVLTTRTTVDNNKITSQQNIEYRDIGFQINIHPKIRDDYVVMDLNLTSETIDSLSETPITSKITFHNSFRLYDGNPILLTGFNIHQKNVEKYKIPILGDLPYINPVFRSESIDQNNYVLSILIETIE